MKNLPRRWWVAFGIAAGVLTATTSLLIYIQYSLADYSFKPPTFALTDLDFLRDGLRVTHSMRFDEEVTALATSHPSASPKSPFRGSLYVGTSPAGSIHRYDPQASGHVSAQLAFGLGDQLRSGTCNLNAILVRDIDGDGSVELLASTSQITPRGRPRLYLMGLGVPSYVREIVRPDIQSSWSHGLGILRDPSDNSASIYVTYCGYGEIVEFKLRKSDSAEGFRHESLAWRQVGQLPASGEWLQTADFDNDGENDLGVATGFAEGKAAIHIYERTAKGELKLKQKIEESGRFANVHFIAGDLSGTGTNDVVAWWCSEIDGGACEMIRYRLGPGGVTERTPILAGNADEIMPRDGQMLFHDLDQDGRLELWFAARAGSLWRFDPGHADTVELMLRVKSGLGSLVGLNHDSGLNFSGIYFAVGRDVWQLRASE